MSKEAVYEAFSKLPKEMPIITYCYSSYCMLSKNVGNYLASKGVFVKHLTAGRYEIDWDFQNYVVSGSKPGETNATYYPPTACAPDGGFGC
jgi:hypothetical protein